MAVLTEGFDDPGVSCVAMARPTRNEGLYAQCVGRGTRLFPGKTDCLILDFVDLSALDPSAARAIDQEIGLNRVTVFAEMNYAWVNGFGRGNKLDLSDTTFSAGLGFEF